MKQMHVLKGIRRIFWAAALLACGFGPALAESYRLAPGDAIRAQVLGLEAAPYVARVNAAGNIRLPYLGMFRAAGKTLEELIADISIASTGQQIELRENGVSKIFVLEENDIFIDIETYRPITVIGAVGTPGRVSFEPGLSVRAAIGVAGGFLLPGQRDSGIQLANQRIQLDSMRETEAWLAADLWRVDALLGRADTRTPPEELAGLLTGTLNEDEINVVRARILGALEQRERDREDLKARIELAESQIEFLKIALSQFETASLNEEDRLQTIIDLSERGLATSNALDDARDAALNMSSRLLTTQADLADAERELQALQRSELELDAQFMQTQLNDKSRLERNLAELRARIRSIRSELALSALVAEDETVVPGYRVVLHRRADGAEVSEDINLGALVRPGDVIEVVLEDT